MENKAKSIGEKYWTEEMGEVKIIDIYISLTTQERLYKVKCIGVNIDFGMETYLEGGSLI